MPKRVTIQDLSRMKAQRQPVTMLTAYDFPVARLLDEAGVDVILVGDSLGMVVLGYDSTAPVTMEEMVHHAKAARRGVQRALFIGDMPLEAFAAGSVGAVANAKRFMEEAGCDGVKLEWKPGMEVVAKAIVEARIPVMGHVGLTPQTVTDQQGYGMRGKAAEEAADIVSQANALQDAGCFAIVLECLPDLLAEEMTRRLSIPTIGIGSGPQCDGQVVVTYDLLGLFERFKPRFVKRYAQLSETIRQAATSYSGDVRNRLFPGKEHTTGMRSEEFQKLKERLGWS